MRDAASRGARVLIVVAAALVRDGALLAAQRSYPPALAGQWELPGGKVSAGEAEPAALRRECREELGIDVSVGARVGADIPTVGIEGVLRVYACSLASGEPVAREHLALRWLTAADLGGVDWLAGDLPLLPALEALLLRA